MSTESEIRTLLQRGYTPKSIIETGYKKSTVYKVFNDIRTYSGQVRKSDCVFERIEFDHLNARYFPGESASLTFELVNYSNEDLYVVNVGIRPEWMAEGGLWYCQLVKDILKPRQRRKISMTFEMPPTMVLGEYEVLFGFEGQFLPVQGYRETSLVTMWTEPCIIHLQYPLIGEKIFLSHSTKDIHLIRELEKHLDNYGIQVLIGQDDEQPGRALEQKFVQMIQSSSIFLAILTDAGVRSPMVRKEISYAIGMGKPCILMKEESVTLDWNAEWISFPSYSSPESMFQILMTALENVKKNQGFADSPLFGILVVALGSFLLGWFLRK